ncbi:P-loop containing nucleoside triphosphate hydrolase protein [Dacryopinax primogenitus]|uniref:p-loop containing nucleoside triphosphate hydrolase protein n=1 Tax=Dacryopinax primogenitus (strain DJM 731) TaxID=1858805 RepID=M5FR34_DACPD|nr:P-loop containing nucleoside triphosphate hydrolase protein [Dacryopinax primogenitus]EJT98068.1 P-loop containing nucleoside triphosphate hydrolase protein [Dacryopinax primogenitus]
MREFRKVLELSDVIIQVLDARDPLGSRSKVVETAVRMKAGEGKRLILVINKIDLVPRENVEAWLKYLRHDFPTVAFKCSTQEQRANLAQRGGGVNSIQHSSSECLGAESLIQLLKNYSRSSNLKTSVTVGIVGFPNVGKSSVINSLKRSRVCGVAATPGHTKVAQEVVLDKNVKLLDCPGIVFATGIDLRDGESKEANVRNEAEILLRNVVKVELVEDPITPVGVIVSRCKHDYLRELYQIPAYKDSNEFLLMLALTRGRLGKACFSFGGRPDVKSAARIVLRDWNTGKILYHTEPPKVHPSSKPSDAPVQAHRGTTVSTDVGQASIVKEWSAPFDLAGLFNDADKEVFGNQTQWPEYGFMTKEKTSVSLEEKPQPGILCPSERKRARSASISSEEDVDVRLQSKSMLLIQPAMKRLKLGEERKFRIDAHEISTLGSSNPLNRARLRKALKQAKKNEATSRFGKFALADKLSGLEMAQ